MRARARAGGRPRSRRGPTSRAKYRVNTEAGRTPRYRRPPGRGPAAAGEGVQGTGRRRWYRTRVGETTGHRGSGRVVEEGGTQVGPASVAVDARDPIRAGTARGGGVHGATATGDPAATVDGARSRCGDRAGDLVARRESKRMPCSVSKGLRGRSTSMRPDHPRRPTGIEQTSPGRRPGRGTSGHGVATSRRSRSARRAWTERLSRRTTLTRSKITRISVAVSPHERRAGSDSWEIARTQYDSPPGLAMDNCDRPLVERRPAVLDRPHS